MSAAEDAREWAVCVQSDLTTIACVLRGERVPWDSACFHAQQAVEKALKAHLVAQGRRPPRTHDCLALLELCRESEPGLSRHAADCAELTQYALMGRYPTVAACPEGEEGLSVVRRARAIALDILSSLGIGLDDPLEDSV